MESMRRLAAATLCVAVGMGAAGCGKSLAVPKDFCGVPARETTLAPLLPEGEHLKNWQAEPPGAYADCSLQVDGTQILDVTVRRIEDQLAPEDWRAATKRFSQAAGRNMNFPGTAVIGSDGALVSADCGTPSSYLTFSISFHGDRVEHSGTGYKKLQRFLDEFVPAVTKKVECTADS
ncbi:hypothetical protein ACIPWY_18045 [Streptomyces sp. NPDC090032]|uniref:hypothetical protein n=1 Tax=unclassified Streptomyces TaxID=2593676 RepID=UPI00372039CD